MGILKLYDGKVAILPLKSSGNHVALVGDEDLKSWEMVGNLLIYEVWEPCKYYTRHIEANNTKYDK